MPNCRIVFFCLSRKEDGPIISLNHDQRWTCLSDLNLARVQFDSNFGRFARTSWDCAEESHCHFDNVHDCTPTPNFWHTEQTVEFTERQLFETGYRPRCISCPRIHLLQNIRLLMLPILTVEEQRLFVSAVSIAKFPELPTMHFIMLCSFCLLELRGRWRRWHNSCGFF